jgi:tetratricopeptide (TPR) repeat protein
LTLQIVINAQKDDLAKQFQFADSLYNAGSHYDAVIEAERLLYFDSLKVYHYKTNFLKGLCYRETGQFKNAKNCFELAAVNTSSRDEQFFAEQEILKILILERRYSVFDKRVETLSKIFPDKSLIFEYWRGWRYAFSGDWEEAKEKFAISDSTGELIKLCTIAEEKELSMTKGVILSALIPGAGQVYAGEYLNSVITLGWVAFGAWLVYDAIKADRFFDALIEANYVLFRFYKGNISNTVEYINRRNLEIKNETLRFLQLNYKGLKP